MEREIKVTFQKITKEFPANIKIVDVCRYFQSYFSYPILIAKVDNELVSLGEELTRKANIDFYDRSSPVGNGIYGRSLQYIVVLAVKRVLGPDAEVVIEHSMDKGFYCEILRDGINEKTINNIEKEMRNIVKQDLIFNKISVLRTDAIKFFKKEKQYDKVKVLKYISNTYVNLYRIDNIYDYFYGDLAYSTKDIDEFSLTYIADNGFVVSYPDVYNPEVTLDYKHHKLLFDKFLDYTKWGRTIGVTNAADLNEVVSHGKADELIHLSEAYYNGQISRIADDIFENHPEVKLVLIAGPTSSGKTTTARKLETYLCSKGLITHRISVDDYYLNRRDTPRDANGDYDYENITAIDLNLFNKHLMKLLAGEKVLLPEYNFITGEREYKNRYLKLGEKDIIVIEGLHALNEDLTMSIEKRYKYKIYISPLTQLNIDNHNRIHTSDTRRLRRIVRDHKTRGYSAAETLSRWKKIREGEEKYIFPFQDTADVIINSALIYEIGVLKTYAEPLLFSVEDDDPAYPEALRLINFLRNFLPIPSEEVPRDSVLREFIGGSCYKN